LTVACSFTIAGDHLPEDRKAYACIKVATIIIVAATLAGGCSGPQPTRDGLVLNNTTTATVRPDTSISAVNNTTIVGKEENNSIYPVIGYDAAISSVRSFMRNPAANVSCECLSYYYYFPAYSLVSDGDTFLVNAWTGEVMYADFEGIPAGNFQQGNVIDAEQGRSFAEAYASEHYAGFNAMTNMEYMGSELHQDGNCGYFYEYEWREIVDNVRTLNDITVAVGVGSGKIHTYQGIRAPTGSDANFTVSKGDAVRIAVASIGNITQEYTFSDDPANWHFDILFKFASPDQNGNWFAIYHTGNSALHTDLFMDENERQHVVWDVETSMLRDARANETYAFGETLHYRVDVDAGTGEVLRTVHSR
jgi:hypothetical protein